MPRHWKHEAIITGRGAFPVIMLARQQCFPATEEDGLKIAATFGGDPGEWEIRVVTRRSTSGACWLRAWDEFGCDVFGSDVEEVR